MNLSIVPLSVAGMILSSYALVIKHQMKKNKKYHAMCDINEKISCTKAMGSRYGSLFVIPNSVFGVVFYGILLLLGISGNTQAVFYLSSLAVIGSVYLAYLSFYKLKIVCPLCVLVYTINVLLWASSV